MNESCLFFIPPLYNKRKFPGFKWQKSNSGSLNVGDGRHVSIGNGLNVNSNCLNAATFLAVRSGGHPGSDSRRPSVGGGKPVSDSNGQKFNSIGPVSIGGRHVSSNIALTVATNSCNVDSNGLHVGSGRLAGIFLPAAKTSAGCGVGITAHDVALNRNNVINIPHVWMR